MPTNLTNPVTGNIIQATDVSQFRVPVNNLETGATWWAGTTAGGATAYTATSAVTASKPGPTLTAGQPVTMIFNVSNTGAATLALNGGAAVAIRRNGVALTGGELVAGGIYTLIYDGTSWEIASSNRISQLVDPSGVARVSVDATGGVAIGHSYLGPSNSILLANNTASGSDNGTTTVAGGGLAGNARGATLTLNGVNSGTLPGQATLYAGAGGSVVLADGAGTARIQINASGQVVLNPAYFPGSAAMILETVTGQGVLGTNSHSIPCLQVKTFSVPPGTSNAVQVALSGTGFVFIAITGGFNQGQLYGVGSTLAPVPYASGTGWVGGNTNNPVSGGSLYNDGTHLNLVQNFSASTYNIIVALIGIGF